MHYFSRSFNPNITGEYHLLDIGIMVRVFANGPEDLDSTPKTQKVVIDATLQNTQHYKVRIKGKVG